MFTDLSLPLAAIDFLLFAFLLAVFDPTAIAILYGVGGFAFVVGAYNSTEKGKPLLWFIWPFHCALFCFILEAMKSKRVVIATITGGLSLIMLAVGEHAGLIFFAVLFLLSLTVDLDKVK